MSCRARCSGVSVLRLIAHENMSMIMDWSSTRRKRNRPPRVRPESRAVRIVSRHFVYSIEVALSL